MSNTDRSEGRRTLNAYGRCSSVRTVCCPPSIAPPTYEIVSGTKTLSSKASVSYVAGGSDVTLPASAPIGYAKTIVNTGPSVFSTTGYGIDASGANGTIYKMVRATIGLGAGLIFVAGDALYFKSIGGISTNINGIACYNPTGAMIAGVAPGAWAPLRTGLSPTIPPPPTPTTSSIAYAMTFDLSGDLYVGGTFTAADSVVGTKNLAKWSVGTAGASAVWSSVFTINSPSTGSQVRALTTDPSGNIYIGGTFTSINTPAFLVNNICMYSPSTGAITALGATVPTVTNNGVTGGTVVVSGLFYDTSTNFLYVGGTFTSANTSILNTSVLNVAYWDTTASPSWKAMNDTSAGIVGVVGQENGFLKYSPTEIYVYGAITNLGPNTVTGVLAGRYAVWTGTRWVSKVPTSGGMIFDGFATTDAIYFAASTGILYIDLSNDYVYPYVAGTLNLNTTLNTFLNIPETNSYYIGGRIDSVGLGYNTANNIIIMNLDNELTIKPIEYLQPSKALMTFAGDSMTVRWNGTNWFRETVAGSVIFIGPLV